MFDSRANKAHQPRQPALTYSTRMRLSAKKVSSSSLTALDMSSLFENSATLQDPINHTPPHPPPESKKRGDKK